MFQGVQADLNWSEEQSTDYHLHGALPEILSFPATPAASSIGSHRPTIFSDTVNFPATPATLSTDSRSHPGIVARSTGRVTLATQSTRNIAETEQHQYLA